MPLLFNLSFTERSRLNNLNMIVDFLCLFFLSFVNLFFLRFYLFERAREHEQGEGQREREKQTPR